MPRITLIAPGVALLLALAPGCDREPDPLLCGDLAAGDLVLTEVRGGPSITDQDGQWLELYNASGGPIDLHGLAITIQSVSGNDTDRVLVRRPAMVEAGGYTVIGKFLDSARPAHVDVGWGTAPNLPLDGAISLACAGDIDRLTFTSLPDPSQIEDALPLDPPPAGHGTYSFGVVPPTATGNDDASKWCADSTETMGACNQTACLKYYKGSPGEPNPGCTP